MLKQGPHLLQASLHRHSEVPLQDLDSNSGMQIQHQHQTLGLPDYTLTGASFLRLPVHQFSYWMLLGSLTGAKNDTLEQLSHTNNPDTVQCAVLHSMYTVKYSANSTLQYCP